MTPLQTLLNDYRTSAVTEKEKGTYFEELIQLYLKTEPTYRDLYSDVWTYGQWATGAGQAYGRDASDEGIDLVAKTQGTDEYHAIQCKFYAADHTVRKANIDSFFTASGQRPFVHRLIVASTDKWDAPADKALAEQQIPVNKIDLAALENSQIDWSQFQADHPLVLKEQKTLRPHQHQALQAVRDGLAQHDRGKMIMACGTGKTLTSLKIAETVAGPGKRVLFLVPSLALLSQTLTEWTQESDTPIHAFAVCSDAHVGKRRNSKKDRVETFLHELRYPATTRSDKLAAEMAKRHDPDHMSVVFSTYHSIEVLHQAQTAHGLAAFDLIICDEAHRTTGAKFDDEDESHFTKVHDNECIQADKRLYMTATPRIYGDTSRVRAEENAITLCSMDDEQLYGTEWYVLNFSESVSCGLLVDYKVIVLAMEEAHISRRLQGLFADDDNQLRVDDAAKIVGCWKALSKEGLQEKDTTPMQRAVAFCQVIEHKPGQHGTHKISSKHIAAMFQSVVAAYQEEEETPSTLVCEAEHIDGTMNASVKDSKLTWLKSEDLPDNHCRVLSNVRCLSEGVDVPALDAVLFLTPRNSQVDVVQSVGRVMRKAPGKERGYVILPVVIPAGMEPDKALNDNRPYKVVWQVLQALRSHDDQFDAFVNKLDLTGSDGSKMEVIAVTDHLAKTPSGEKRTGSSRAIGQAEPGSHASQVQDILPFEVGEIERAIYAKLVQKCGRRLYWDEWASDIARIAQTHITRIATIVSTAANTEAVRHFNVFAKELRDDLNDSITDEEVIEMLAQHLITRPVFDALFEGADFARRNPMSMAMQQVLDVLQEHHLENEADTLERFYASVRMRASGIDQIEGKQRIMVELYDKFFRNAFPRMTKRLGIVYTPVEVVDFIIHSVNDLLQQEFGQSLGSKGVHILDPFTGTGTFITRLLQSGLIKPEELLHKYQHEIHANEIVLLAYYIAAINIEAVYHSLAGDEEYVPFEGICLTDTFQMHESQDLLAELFPDNSERRTRQKALDIRVIMSNPPYSSGQKSENDNAKNVNYPSLDKRIEGTYVEHSDAALKRYLYDSYIRAIRWGSDRLGDVGVMAYVTNAGWIDGNAMDGLRKCLAEEFASLYVFHLRGDQRTSGETSREEGGKIFGSGSRAPIAITVLVKNPAAKQQGQIYFHDIGDYHSREDKLKIIADFGSITGITKQNGWQTLVPDANHDWLDQADPDFNRFLVLGDKKDKSAVTVFENYSLGVATNRDAWCYNTSRDVMERNIRSMIDCYNAERDRYHQDTANKGSDVGTFVNNDPNKISWTHRLKQDLGKNKALSFADGEALISVYRPFTKQWLYYGRRLNERVYQMPQIFPNAAATNRVICVTGISATAGFSALMLDAIPDLNMLQAGAQCFPLKLYQKHGADRRGDSPGNLFGDSPEYQTSDGISDAALAHFQAAYPGESISKEDLFYYIYGLLHAEDYRTRYRNNLMKQLPRIPAVASYDDFRAFQQAGEALAELHVNYETAAPWPVTINDGAGVPQEIAPERLYRVEKMKFGGTGKDKDKTTIIYNPHITVSDIPLAAYAYSVSGTPAIQWLMERQGITTDNGSNGSGTVKDANRYATETMANPAYPLELLQRVIRVAMDTLEIVKALPPLQTGRG